MRETGKGTYNLAAPPNPVCTNKPRQERRSRAPRQRVSSKTCRGCLACRRARGPQRQDAVRGGEPSLWTFFTLAVGPHQKRQPEYRPIRLQPCPHAFEPHPCPRPPAADERDLVFLPSPPTRRLLRAQVQPRCQPEPVRSFPVRLSSQPQLAFETLSLRLLTCADSNSPSFPSRQLARGGRAEHHGARPR